MWLTQTKELPVTAIKLALLVTSFAFAFSLLHIHPGMAIVCAGAALAIMCSLWFDEEL